MSNFEKGDGVTLNFISYLDTGRMSTVTVEEWNDHDNTDGHNLEVKSLYEKTYNRRPLWVIRCPGRVNLIGEHIDHNGYGVLPMALKVATFVAVGLADNKKLNLINYDPKYKSTSFDVSDLIASSKLDGRVEWFHYFIAGWRGAVESSLNIFPLSSDCIAKVHGLNVAVAGNIPPSAGLSSSSALVCAAVLATLSMEKDPKALATVDRRDLAEIATKAERFVGTEGGGMDQACECLADADFVLRIDFHPLRCSPVLLPPNALFAVMHSGTELNKAATDHYNQRVVECRLAAQVLCKLASKFGCDGGKIIQKVRTLRHAADAFELGDEDPALMLCFINKYLKTSDGGRYSRQEVLDILGVSDEQLVEWSLSANTVGMQEFWLTKRARHVYSEAARVLAFERACRRITEAPITDSDNGGLEELAQLMNDSHASCRDDFECSCPELDSLVVKCVEAGCLGARLTGAGWGGCVIALVDANNREEINKLAKELNILFWSEPSKGIKALRVSDN